MFSRRSFLELVGGAAVGSGLEGKATPSVPGIEKLRRDIVDSPVRVGLHRARTFTRVFQRDEGKPWIVNKAAALNEYFRTVPLYIRQHDGIAGSISEEPGAMPLIVECGIAENGIYTGEYPKRRGYLEGKVPPEIKDYWSTRNLAGRYLAESANPSGGRGKVGRLLANVGHLSPSYAELLKLGISGILQRIKARRQSETDPEKLAFLTAAALGLSGVSEWSRRYAEFLVAEAGRCADRSRASELREMSRIAAKVASEPPSTFREAMQLIWFAQQAIHIEGHGYSNTPDHIDLLLYPFYMADKKAGHLDDAQALRLCENFVLKMRDNTFWGPEHNLTQGLCLGGSTPDGRDLTNRLSWLFVEAATNVAVPEPLVWIRWHPKIDQSFFDFCLSRLARNTCFPMIWNDKAITEALMELGISRDDAYDYIAVGCNEIAVPGRFSFHSAAHANYLEAVELALSSGKGYEGNRQTEPLAAPVSELKTFDQFAAAVGAYLRRSVKQSYAEEMGIFKAHMKWGQTPLTSCFFEGCIEKAHDLILGVKYNNMSCGGPFFVTAVDSLAAIRLVVFEKKTATLEQVGAACRGNFKGYERLRAQLLAAPKHGNDDPRLDDVIRLVERLRDEPVRDICRDPRTGSRFGNTHVVRSAAVKTGLQTPATPDGRLAKTPLASSMAGSPGSEKSGPTAVLNSVCKLNSKKSWQSGYQVNMRFLSAMLADNTNRDKVRAMLNSYFERGGQEIQINCIDTAVLRAAQKNPEQYRDLVVRVAGFSEFFVNLRPDIQEELIQRMEFM